MNPRVTSVTPQEGYKLKVYFSNNEIGLFDCSKFLNIGVFKELRDIHYFNQVKALGGTVVWPHEQDFCPDTVYLDAVPHVEQDAAKDADKRRR